MKIQGNPTLKKTTLPYVVARIRTKQGAIHANGNRVNRGKAPINATKRAKWRRFAARSADWGNYARATSHGYSESY